MNKIHYKQLIAGEIVMRGRKKPHISPINQIKIGEVLLANIEDIKLSFSKLNNMSKITEDYCFDNFRNLAYSIKENKHLFIHQMIQETGYAYKDCEDIVENTVSLLNNYKSHIRLISKQEIKHPYSFSKMNKRRIMITQLPYGIISAITPQNAPLIIEVTVLINALFSGNCIVIKPSTQSASTAALLIDAICKSFNQMLLKRISIIVCKAPLFLNEAYNQADLIHFIGGSKYLREVVSNGITNAKQVIIDGEGGSVVLVDKDFDLKDATNICKNGIIRCNGELCTTIKIILVHNSKVNDFFVLLNKKLSEVRVGNPNNRSTEMGPLFGIEQINPIYREILKNSNVKINGNTIFPHLIKIDKNQIRKLKTFIFGPIAFLVPYEKGDWRTVLGLISYSLSDVVLTNNKDFENDFIKASRAQRIVVNADPTEESPFEPWGATLPNGYNNLSYWLYKYTRAVQIDKLYE